VYENQAALSLSPETCMELLASTGIGRVILTEQAMPTALPVAFAVDHGAIIFRSSAGTKLAAATSGTVIAFEVDSFDENQRAGWSVVATGLASVITDPQDEERARNLEIPNWVEPDGARFIRLLPSIVTGRRVGAQPGRPAAAAPAG
jgi:nitroimidazol reductase NimA-like FMN-containing flavoprotein (pyridoxamine 5'-phosphate oxidase superfamily)